MAVLEGRKPMNLNVQRPPPLPNGQNLERSIGGLLQPRLSECSSIILNFNNHLNRLSKKFPGTIQNKKPETKSNAGILNRKTLEDSYEKNPPNPWRVEPAGDVSTRINNP